MVVYMYMYCTHSHLTNPFPQQKKYKQIQTKKQTNNKHTLLQQAPPEVLATKHARADRRRQIIRSRVLQQHQERWIARCGRCYHRSNGRKVRMRVYDAHARVACFKFCATVGISGFRLYQAAEFQKEREAGWQNCFAGFGNCSLGSTCQSAASCTC